MNDLITMNKEEREKQKELIIQQYGEPERDFDRTALNESAKRIDQLNASYLQTYNEAKKTKKLANQIKELKSLDPLKPNAVPEQVVRNEWLVTFNNEQKSVVSQWLKDTKQSIDDISRALNVKAGVVKQTMGLEAFNLLRRHITLGWKELLPLEALGAVREALHSTNDNVKLNAAMLILNDAGYIKSKNAGDNEVTSPVNALDAETRDRLSKIAQRMRDDKDKG